MTRFSFKQLGPGLLFAGAAIGVSHLVQSTTAGAQYGFGLIWALLLIHLIKYPFFQFGPRYAAATGKSLLDAYLQLGKGVLWFYFILNLLSMFTIQAAVTVVTASLASYIFGSTMSILGWSAVITAICTLLLMVGRYQLLDKVMKIIVVTLTVSTLAAVAFAFFDTEKSVELSQIIPSDTAGIAFLIAFMGWMPAPLDISIWHSLWSLEKAKEEKITEKSAVFDFNVGYAGTILVGICFIGLGALVMYHTGTTFSSSGTGFAKQLIDMYTSSLGSWTFWIIGIAAFTTMFSTTLTTLDASPRAMAKTTELLTGAKIKHMYTLWLALLIIGTLSILAWLSTEMGTLITLATILSFLSAPFYAYANYRAMTSPEIPESARPGKGLRILCFVSMALLIGFCLWYLSTLLS
ncbi:Nramp family divalent metal transporter [Flavimarina sp. Hel_I_48]|uniref:Nramp family divalent metal transporter n=1 Tax=Flavimarina sp. Hel_I_48 TaxID=1392488 RepID=UPI0004DF461B|nr:Nramp family divalent metal transporter [Flavimarina sp. Hel_I_48]